MANKYPDLNINTTYYYRIERVSQEPLDIHQDLKLWLDASRLTRVPTHGLIKVAMVIARLKR